jgi:outer membrane protein OmpA-like peptidoglycan-associated protein
VLGLASALALLAADPALPAPAATAVSDNGPWPSLVRPIPGAKVVDRSTRSFDEYWMPLGKLIGDGQAEKNELLEGKWTHLSLTGPEGRSVADAYRVYEQQMTKAGLEVMYACKGVECGEGGRKTNGDWWALSDNRRFLAARLQRAEGDIWVSVHVHARSTTALVEHELDFVEMKPPAQPPPPRNEADPATLGMELKTTGHVVLHSLGFVEGRPVVLPESEPVVKAIAELLVRDPGLKLHVVVHSDYAMPAAASLDLTKKQAAAVVTMLTRRHGIPAARIHAAGLGPLAPIAPNETDEGRTLNRRVELVPESADRGRAAAVRSNR